MSTPHIEKVYQFIDKVWSRGDLADLDDRYIDVRDAIKREIRTALTNLRKETYDNAFAAGVASTVVHSVDVNVEKVRKDTISECIEWLKKSDEQQIAEFDKLPQMSEFQIGFKAALLENISNYSKLQAKL